MLVKQILVSKIRTGKCRSHFQLSNMSKRRNSRSILGIDFVESRELFSLQIIQKVHAISVRSRIESIMDFIRRVENKSEWEIDMRFCISKLVIGSAVFKSHHCWPLGSSFEFSCLELLFKRCSDSYIWYVISKVMLEQIET